MSAYIMSDQQINDIVNYFVNATASNQLWIKVDGDYCYLTRDNARIVASILYLENVRSVDARYNETNTADFAYKASYNTVTDKEVSHLIDSLEYQSCETDDYYTTEAYKILCSMRKNLLQRIFAEEVDYQELAVWTN